MSLYKPKKSPYWQYDFVINGVRYNGSTRVASKRDAQAVENDVRRRAMLGEKVKPSINLLAATDAWWDAKGQFMRSAKTVKYQLVNLADGLGPNLPLQDLGLAEIDAYIAKRRATVSNASVNREMELLRSVINWCAARNYASPEIQWKEAMLKEAAVQTRVLTDEEETALFAKLPDSLKPIVEFALISGQRKAEIVTLRWADVDLKAGRATVWAKGQKPHTFPLTPRLTAIIANQPKVCPQVFTYVCERDSPPRKDRVARKKGERYPFSRQGWDRKWRRALAAAGVDNFRFHDTRHTALTRTNSIEVAFALAGHTDIRTTKRYFHTAEDVVRQAMIAAESRTIPEPQVEMAEKPRKAAND